MIPREVTFFEKVLAESNPEEKFPNFSKTTTESKLWRIGSAALVGRRSAFPESGFVIGEKARV